MQEQTQYFQIGQVVWAKITGYPWWPAQVFNRIIKPNAELQVKQEYSVMFFGDNSHAYLPASKLTTFQSKYQLHSTKCSSKKFQQAMLKADRFTTTRQGSLLDQEIVIDSHPKCLSFDKSTTFAHQDKVMRMKDIEEIPETTALVEPVHFQQKILLQQFSEEDLNSINQSNIVQLLQYGLVSSIREAGYQKEFVKSVEESLKTKLLNKYSLQEVKTEQLIAVEEEPEIKRTVSKTKRIFKKKRSGNAQSVHADELPIKRLCIIKLYQFLKCSVSERSKAMKTSVETIDRLMDHYQIASQQFKFNYKRLLQWLSTHNETKQGINPEYLYQKLEEFIHMLCNNQNHPDEKSKESDLTTYSEMK